MAVRREMQCFGYLRQQKIGIFKYILSCFHSLLHYIFCYIYIDLALEQFKQVRFVEINPLGKFTNNYLFVKMMLNVIYTLRFFSI